MLLFHRINWRKLQQVLNYSCWFKGYGMNTIFILYLLQILVPAFAEELEWECCQPNECTGMCFVPIRHIPLSVPAHLAIERHKFLSNLILKKSNFVSNPLGIFVLALGIQLHWHLLILVWTDLIGSC